MLARKFSPDCIGGYIREASTALWFVPLYIMPCVVKSFIEGQTRCEDKQHHIIFTPLNARETYWTLSVSSLSYRNNGEGPWFCSEAISSRNCSSWDEKFSKGVQSTNVRPMHPFLYLFSSIPNEVLSTSEYISNLSNKRTTRTVMKTDVCCCTVASCLLTPHLSVTQ